MARITDLAQDTILYIVALDRESANESFPESDMDVDGSDARIYGPWFRTFRMRELSLVCRAFNSACSFFLFHTHVLSLREQVYECGTIGSFEDLDRAKKHRERLDCRFADWELEHARERIAALLRKGAFVRDLTIIDVCGNDGVEAFPEAFMGELMNMFKELTGLLRLTLSTGRKERPIPLILWNWIQRRGNRLKDLTIGGWWSVPKDNVLLPIDGVERLNLEPLCVHTKPFLKLIKTPNLTMTHYTIGDHYMPLYPFRPSAEEGAHLRNIHIAISRRDGVFDADGECVNFMYDFSKVPQANVRLLVGSGKHQARTTEEWDGIRDAIRRMFCEHPSTYDVVRRDWQVTASITKLARPGWKPQNQAHRYKFEHTKEELKEVQGLCGDYYAAMRFREMRVQRYGNYM
ncbi:hypothetical protein DFH11DRAFT_1581504 [Phellopilus nigrolimitatus]|nr:hypothetical protein DFH11DRAFT_1581504 [Phellopilus nigrolimitatus]